MRECNLGHMQYELKTTHSTEIEVKPRTGNQESRESMIGSSTYPKQECI
jgi:hypothetical protein